MSSGIVSCGHLSGYLLMEIKRAILSCESQSGRPTSRLASFLLKSAWSSHPLQVAICYHLYGKQSDIRSIGHSRRCMHGCIQWGPGGPDPPPPWGARYSLFNIGPKVRPPPEPPPFFACRPKLDPPPPFQNSAPVPRQFQDIYTAEIQLLTLPSILMNFDEYRWNGSHPGFAVPWMDDFKRR